MSIFAQAPLWHPSGLSHSISAPVLSAPPPPPPGDEIRIKSIRLPETSQHKGLKSFLDNTAHFKRMMCRAKQPGTSESDVRNSVSTVSSAVPSFTPIDKEKLLARDRLRAKSASVESRRSWQSEMGRSVNRLLCDIELGLGKPHDFASHHMRVKLMDDVHHWYIKAGQKQARKALPSPGFLRYHVDEPPDPGSLRPFQGTEWRWQLPKPPPTDGWKDGEEEPVKEEETEKQEEEEAEKQEEEPEE